ncbi:unnamed protein product [Protopolystoma xenopodis]|uniref:ATPase V1 complex subunit H C-terminal domain-containing protein n=1 Tax=Protopolystoma xenopodis TaxID=117903 RepID=A0A3S5CJ41_9PLAT|nr:unnamed protein product [Protopolystoma xenopodis]
MELDDLTFYVNWLCGQLRKPRNDFLETAARNLQMVLRVREYRQTFVAENGINTIVEVLVSKNISKQLQYQLIFCLWCLSFDAVHVMTMSKNSQLIPIVSDIFREAEREKIIRISLALFRFILEKLPPPYYRDCALAMVQCKVLKQLKLLNQKDFSHDPEISDDMAYLEVGHL